MSEMCDLLKVFKNKFRTIENITKKCVNLEGAITYLYIIYIYDMHKYNYIYIYISNASDTGCEIIPDE